MLNKSLPLKENSRERGTVIIFVAVGILLLLGIAAFALDFGHLHIVNNELQNASDTVALAGASALYPNTPPTEPNFPQAQTVATNAINLNKSDGTTLINCQVQTGYWDLTQNQPGLQPSLPVGVTLGGVWVPAVMGSVNRADGQNSGPMLTWFATIFGINSISARKEATAVVAFPGGVSENVLLPVAINKTVADQLWDKPGTSFRIGSSYHYPDSQAGQWTSFLIDQNNVPYVRDLIESGNPDPIKIGDQIWIQPGTENTLYENSKQWSINRRAGETVCLAIVDGELRDNTHAYMPVVGFITFHINFAVGGSEKYIDGYFDPGSDACAGGTGGGPNYGATLPPKLVR